MPCAIVCEVGKHVTLDMIRVCLTANEIKYNKNEVLFLTQIFSQLIHQMTPDDYRRFVIRLLALRGTKEFYNDCLHYALDLCSETPKYRSIFNVCLPKQEEDEPNKMEIIANGDETDGHSDNNTSYEVVASNNLIINAKYINTILKMQTVSVSKLSSEKNYTEIIQLFFTKSESDLTPEEKNELCEAIIKAQMWQKGIELFENWSELNDSCLDAIYQCVKSGSRARLTPKMLSKVLKYAIEGKSALPWIIIYWSLVAEGIDLKEPNNPLIKFCTIGHHYLGRKGLCTAHDGEFLLCALKVFVEHDIDDVALNCISCLFNFPSRKSQNTGHSSPHIDLKWTHCEDIYFYFEPNCMPEFDSHARQTGISQETKDLFLKMLRLIPEDQQPLKQSQNITNYINNGDSLVEPVFQNTPPRILTTIYYLLADFHFKNRDFAKARQFYIFDLAINLKRFDSWAGLALATNYQLDQMLIEGSNTNSNKFQRTAFSAIQCFDQALKLEESNSKLWIEFGLLTYNLSSNMSRIEKLSQIFESGYEEVNTLFKYEDMLAKAQHCFQKANACETDNDELWLSYYMLGKVSEKKSENVLTTLQYYERADLCLFLDSAAYPKKINYYNPQYLAVEALEIHYRIHVCVLKYLINNRKFSARMLRQLKLHILNVTRSSFVSRKAYSASSSSQTQKKPSGSKGGSSSNDVSQPNEVDAQINELLQDLMSIVCERDVKFDVNRSRNDLMSLCKNGLKRCLSRYTGHYKSHYRLAHYHNHFGDVHTAKSVLIGGLANKHIPDLVMDGDSGKLGAPGYVSGLFAERKPTNFYNGIWRIPVEEIERSGNFNAHMFRCTWLLIRLCSQTADVHTLNTLAMQLYRTPDLDKRYLNEQERANLAKLAFDNCFAIMKANLNKPEINKALYIEEIQNIAQNFIRSNIFAAETFKICNQINSQLGAGK